MVLCFPSNSHLASSVQQSTGEIPNGGNMCCVWMTDKKGIWRNLGCYCEVTRSIAILLGLGHKAVGGNLSQGREVTSAK